MSDYHVSNKEVVGLADTVLQYWLTTKYKGTDRETQMCRYCYAVSTDGTHRDFCPTIIASRIKKEVILLRELDNTCNNIMEAD